MEHNTSINIQTHTVLREMKKINRQTENNKLTAARVCMRFELFSLCSKIKKQSNHMKLESGPIKIKWYILLEQATVRIDSIGMSEAKTTSMLSFVLCNKHTQVYKHTRIFTCECLIVFLFISTNSAVKTFDMNTTHMTFGEFKFQKLILWQLVLPMKNKSPNRMHSIYQNTENRIAVGLFFSHASNVLDCSSHPTFFDTFYTNNNNVNFGLGFVCCEYDTWCFYCRCYFYTKYAMELLWHIDIGANV